MSPSRGHALHGRTQPHASPSGHGHTSTAPPRASMGGKEGGKEAAGSQPVLDAGPSGSPGQGSRLLPALGLTCSIFTGGGTGLWGWIRPPVEATGPWQPGLLRGVLGGRGTLSSPRAVPGGVTQSHPGRGTVPLSLLSPGPTAVQLREQTCSRRPRGAQGILEGAQRESRRPASEPKQGPAWSWGRGPGLEGSPSNQETSLGFE